MDQFNKNLLPKSWVLAEFRDISQYIQRGKSPKYAEVSDYPVINQKCIRWNGIDHSFLKYLDPYETGKWASERFLQVGDILWNSTGTGTIGRASIYQGNLKNAVVDSHVTIVRTTNNYVIPEYVFYFIMSPYVQKNIEKMQSGSTNQVELGRTDIEQTIIPIAPLSEQKRIVEKIEQLFSELDNGLEKLQKALGPIKSCHFLENIHALRQSVLKKAFSGSLVAQNLHDDQSAMVLLEAMKKEKEGKSTKKRFKTLVAVS